MFSSGLIGRFGPPRTPRPDAPAALAAAPPPDFEKENLAKLDDEKLKKGLKLLWFSTGKDDFLLKTTEGTVEMFKKHGFNPVYQESTGGHTWINWRDYLNIFAPQLFQ